MDKLQLLKCVAILLSIGCIALIFINPLLFLQDGDYLQVYSIMFIKTICLIIGSLILFLFGLFYKNDKDKK